MLRRKQNKSKSGKAKSSGRSRENLHKGKKVEEVTTSDEEAPPEAVTFSDSREKMLERKRKLLQQLDLEKQKLKLKRRQQDLTYKEQKKRKLADLDECRLPDDFLEKLPDKELNKIDGNEGKSDNNATETEMEISSDGRPEEAEDLDHDGFIPINKPSSHNIKAIHCRDKLAANISFENATKFKNEHLFGRNIKRQPMSSYLASLDKRKARYPRTVS